MNEEFPWRKLVIGDPVVPLRSIPRKLSEFSPHDRLWGRRKARTALLFWEDPREARNQLINRWDRWNAKWHPTLPQTAYAIAILDRLISVVDTSAERG